jgi:hypothetical protein
VTANILPICLYPSLIPFGNLTGKLRGGFGNGTQS